MPANPLLLRLRRELRKVADPEKAAGMQAYMKTTQPFLGVSAVPMRELCREFFRSVDLTTPELWRESVLALWREAKYREERYAAIGLTGDRRAQSFQRMDALPMYEEMIVSGAWWDLVDGIATRRLGEILRNDPEPMRRTMLQWSRSDDIWKRRGAILCQLHFKEETDLAFLYRCIEPSLSSKEFFLRKAIGWALRQYAWTDAAEVVRYVEQHESRLSALSRREALKNVAPKTASARSSTRKSSHL